MAWDDGKEQARHRYGGEVMTISLYDQQQQWCLRYFVCGAVAAGVNKPCALQCDSCGPPLLPHSSSHSPSFPPPPFSLPLFRNPPSAPPSSRKPSFWKTAPSNSRSGTRPVKNVIAPLLLCTTGGRLRRLLCMILPMPRVSKVRWGGREEGRRIRRRSALSGTNVQINIPYLFAAHRFLLTH